MLVKSKELGKQLREFMQLKDTEVKSKVKRREKKQEKYTTVLFLLYNMGEDI